MTFSKSLMSREPEGRASREDDQREHRTPRIADVLAMHARGILQATWVLSITGQVTLMLVFDLPNVLLGIVYWLSWIPTSIAVYRREKLRGDYPGFWLLVIFGVGILGMWWWLNYDERAPAPDFADEHPA